jgi:hypothetical protein
MYQRRVATSRDHQLLRTEITSSSRGHDKSGFLLEWKRVSRNRLRTYLFVPKKIFKAR